MDVLGKQTKTIEVGELKVGRHAKFASVVKLMPSWLYRFNRYELNHGHARMSK